MVAGKLVWEQWVIQCGEELQHPYIEYFLWSRTALHEYLPLRPKDLGYQD